MSLPPWLIAAQWPMVAVTAIGVYAAVVLFTRLNGLRSFSTMSGFDFVMTIAIGSIVATTILSPRPSLVEGTVALAMLFLLQRLVSWARKRSRSLERGVDNEPLLLMRGDKILERNLERGRVTRDDLRAKLRENGVLRYDEVEAVVLETTGTISVLKRREGVELEEDLLRSVRD